MKTLNISFENSEYEQLSKLKDASGKSWHDYLLQPKPITEPPKPEKDEFPNILHPDCKRRHLMISPIPVEPLVDAILSTGIGLIRVTDKSQWVNQLLKPVYFDKFINAICEAQT